MGKKGKKGKNPRGKLFENIKMNIQVGLVSRYQWNIWIELHYNFK